MRQLFIVAFVLLSFVASAQHLIKGKILNEAGHPLVGATAIINEGNKTLGINANENGSFLFENLKEESYNLTISFLGYQTKSELVKTDNDLIIKLAPKTYAIKEISVYSLRASDRSSVAYSDVSAEVIEKRNTGQDIPYLLLQTPSFIATSDAGTGIGYTGFRIRGTDANRTNITVNGVPLNDAESHGTFFVNMPDFASSVSSIQIQRGVGTSTNGAAAFGASINMATDKIHDKPFGEVSGTIGSFNTKKYTVKGGTGIMSNKLAFEARVSGINSDGYVDRAAVDLKSYYVSAGYYGNKSTLKFITFGGKEKTYQAWNGVDLDMVNADPLKYKRTYNELGLYIDDNGNTQFYDNQTDNYEQIHYQLHWNQELSSFLNLNIGLHYTDGEGYYEEYKTDRDYIEYGLTPEIENGTPRTTTDLIRRKMMDNNFYGAIYSLNYNRNNLNASFGGSINRYDGDHIGKIIWVRNPADDFDAKKDWYFNTGIKDDINFYAKANYNIAEKLFINADIQYRHIKYSIAGVDDKYDYDNSAMRDITQTHVFNFLNPKIGASYTINESNNVYASFSVSNREPNRNNYTDAAGNEQPTEERLFDTEIGYRFQSQNFSFSANIYNMHYKNQLVLTGKISDIGEALTTNIPDSYRRGIELAAGIKLSPTFRWDGNIAFSQSKIKNFTEYVDSYDADWNQLEQTEITHALTDISYSPNVVFNSVFSFDYNSFNFSFISSHVDRQYIDNSSSIDRSINPYFVNNVSVGYFLKLERIQGLNFQLNINNIFDVQYENNGYNWYTYLLDGKRYNEKRYFPQAGANISFTMTVKI